MLSSQFGVRSHRPLRARLESSPVRTHPLWVEWRGFSPHRVGKTQIILDRRKARPKMVGRRGLGHFGMAKPLAFAIHTDSGYPVVSSQAAPIPFWLPSMWRACRLSRTKPLRGDLRFTPTISGPVRGKSRMEWLRQLPGIAGEPIPVVFYLVCHRNEERRCTRST